jgi:hypothetical protein
MAKDCSKKQACHTFDIERRYTRGELLRLTYGGLFFYRGDNPLILVRCSFSMNRTPAYAYIRMS